MTATEDNLREMPGMNNDAHRDDQEKNTSKVRIEIADHGPYLVYGDVPLLEGIITPKGHGYVWREGRRLPQGEHYALCRCGRSKNAPFCDGTHSKIGFTGMETASTETYSERAGILKGPKMDLLDDNRCALARFCHKEHGDVWTLTRNSDDPKLMEEAIEGAMDCPAGRLVAEHKTGETLEYEYEPSIIVIQDPQKHVSGGIFVRGGIPLISSRGQAYETRNRMTLCRCGHSRNMPFCDSTHVSDGYSDGRE